MGILGNVENGWFAQLCHGCEDLSSGVINLFNPGSGEKFYGTMNQVANERVGKINQQAFDEAKKNGATDAEAYAKASAAMDGLANPESMKDFGKLFGTGRSVADCTMAKYAGQGKEFDLGALTPVLIGVGVLGGGFLLADKIF